MSLILRWLNIKRLFLKNTQFNRMCLVHLVSLLVLLYCNYYLYIILEKGDTQLHQLL